MSLALVALWALSRTSGIAAGLAASRPEPVGVLDSVASADEAMLALLAGLGGRFDPRGRVARGVRAVAVLLILLSAPFEKKESGSSGRTP